MRSPNGRFCKVVPKSSAKGQVTETPFVRVEGMAEGEGGEAAIEYIEGSYAIYYIHPKLAYPVCVKTYDEFTFYNLLR